MMLSRKGVSNSKYHKLPIIQYEGQNLEEKETRHDLDSKLVEDRQVRNRKGNL